MDGVRNLAPLLKYLCHVTRKITLFLFHLGLLRHVDCTKTPASADFGDGRSLMQAVRLQPSEQYYTTYDCVAIKTWIGDLFFRQSGFPLSRPRRKRIIIS